MTVRLVEVRIEWLCRCDLAIRLTRRGPRRPRRAAARAARALCVRPAGLAQIIVTGMGRTLVDGWLRLLAELEPAFH